MFFTIQNTLPTATRIGYRYTAFIDNTCLTCTVQPMELCKICVDTPLVDIKNVAHVAHVQVHITVDV